MTATPEPQGPTSWRDVYQLVRDTREDVLKAVDGVDRKVGDVTSRVTAIEDERLVEAASKKAEERVFGRARHFIVSIVALVVSVLSGAAAVFSIITKGTP